MVLPPTLGSEVSLVAVALLDLLKRQPGGCIAASAITWAPGVLAWEPSLRHGAR